MTQGDPFLGRTVAGRYRVSSLLGTGQMARVYLADEVAGGLARRKDDVPPPGGRQVALKLLRPELARDQSSVLRFRREVEAVTRLRSPHAIVFHDFGEDEGTLFIVMEHLQGEPLRARLDREGALDAAMTLHVARQIGACLTEAHNEGIVHRDLKPDNVFLCPPPRQHWPHVKVLDFGLAKLVEGTELEAITAKNTTVGTPAYLAPERIVAGRASDARADLYALGVMVFEMLTGKQPYRTKSLLEMLKLHRDAPIPSAVQLEPSLPPAIDDFLAVALAKHPDQRLQNAPAFLRALGLALGAPQP